MFSDARASANNSASDSADGKSEGELNGKSKGKSDSQTKDDKLKVSDSEYTRSNHKTSARPARSNVLANIVDALRGLSLKGKKSQTKNSPENFIPGTHITNKNWRMLQMLACSVVLIASFLAGGAIVGAGICVLIIIGCYAYKSHATNKAQLELEKQILQLEIQMSENSRSGLSVERSLRTCLEHSEQPIRDHLERMINELTYSSSTVADVFKRFANESGSNDAQLLSSVIDVQQETGSNLADTLDFLAESISEKQKMRQTLRSRIAEMRLTKIMVAASPVVIVGICCMAISGVSDFYAHNPLGWILLGVCALGEAVGIYILNKMSDLEIV